MKDLACAFGALLMALIIATAQSPSGVQSAEGVEYLIAPLGMPCEPGRYLPLAGYPCPPVSQQGILLHVRDTDDVEFDAYHVSVEHTGGTSTATFPRRRDGDRWSSHGFQIGRVKTPDLDGVVVQKITITKLRPAAAPVVITAGAAVFGPPKE